MSNIYGRHVSSDGNQKREIGYEQKYILYILKKNRFKQNKKPNFGRKKNYYNISILFTYFTIYRGKLKYAMITRLLCDFKTQKTLTLITGLRGITFISRSAHTHTHIRARAHAHPPTALSHFRMTSRAPRIRDNIIVCGGGGPMFMYQ